MAEFDIETNAGLIAADLQATGYKAGVRAFEVTRHYGNILVANWKRRASQPRTTPRGPETGGLRNMTGDYLRKIGPPRMSTGLSGPVATAGTTHPGAARQEFGFNEEDSRGYMVKHPPYPTIGPAMDETEPLFVAAIAAIVD